MIRYFVRQEILAMIPLRPELLEEIEAEGLVTPDEEDRFSPEEVERLRVIQVLIDELGVNLAGAEVILQMREEILRAHELFDRVVMELVERLPQ